MEKNVIAKQFPTSIKKVTRGSSSETDITSSTVILRTFYDGQYSFSRDFDGIKLEFSGDNEVPEEYKDYYYIKLDSENFIYFYVRNIENNVSFSASQNPFPVFYESNSNPSVIVPYVKSSDFNPEEYKAEELKYCKAKFLKNSAGYYFSNLCFLPNYDDVNGTLKIEIDSQIGSNPIYKGITLTLCDPYVAKEEITPGDGAFVDDSSKIVIHTSPYTPESESGKYWDLISFGLIWGTSEDSLVNEIEGSLAPEYNIIIPAGTFPSKGTVYCKIRMKTDLHNDYVYSDLFRYTTIDSKPSVKPISPINSNIDSNIENIFKWDYQINSSSSQKAFDLQYSSNNGKSWENIYEHQESEKTETSVPAYTLPSGNILWRVRGYNTDDDPSDWSDSALIVVKSSPVKPIITYIRKTPKIFVQWQSVGQQAFQIIANDYNSGVVFGSKKEFYIPFYFKDKDIVNLKLRVKTALGEWSEWSETSITIENVVTGSINLSVENTGNELNLIWTGDTSFISFYVLRGNIPIAQITDLKEYADYTSVGANEYQIMGITADGYYTLSNVVLVSVFPKTAVIGIMSNTVSWVTLTYRRGNLPEIITSSSEDVYFQYYSGRELPVAYSSRFKTKKKTLNFTVYKQDADAIENMIGQTVIYKDYADNKIIGIVNNVETSSNASRPDVRLEITAIDYLEDVGYD